MRVSGWCGVLLRGRRAAAAVLFYTGTAFGDPADTSESAPSRRQASLHFQRGYELSQSGAFEQAARHFEAASALEPSALVLYNLGQAYAASGQPVEALGAFRKCLQLADSGLDGPLRERVLGAMHVVEGRIGRLSVSVVPPSAGILLDGRPVAREALDGLEVKAGEHVIVSELEGFEAQMQVVKVPPERNADVKIALKPRVLPGLLMISCALPDMVVSIDGAPGSQLTVPASTIAVLPARHTVRLSRPGYQTETYDIDVAAGKTAQVSCSAEADPKAPESVTGMLLIEDALDVGSPGVTVHVDGRHVSVPAHRSLSPDLALRLPTGRHQVELRRPNYKSWNRAFNLSAGARLALQPQWIPTTEYKQELDAAARTRSQWTIAAWGAGAALGVSSAVLGFAALHRHGDWLRERNDLNGSPIDEPRTLMRLKDNQQRALSIQRMNDAAIGLGAIGACLLGAAAITEWSARPRIQASSGEGPRRAPGGALTISREGAYLQMSGRL